MTRRATDPRGFSRRQAVSNGSERAAFQRFLLNLCSSVKSKGVSLWNSHNLRFAFVPGLSRYIFSIQHLLCQIFAIRQVFVFFTCRVIVRAEKIGRR